VVFWWCGCCWLLRKDVLKTAVSPKERGARNSRLSQRLRSADQKGSK